MKRWLPETLGALIAAFVLAFVFALVPATAQDIGPGSSVVNPPDLAQLRVTSLTFNDGQPYVEAPSNKSVYFYKNDTSRTIDSYIYSFGHANNLSAGFTGYADYDANIALGTVQNFALAARGSGSPNYPNQTALITFGETDFVIDVRSGTLASPVSHKTLFSSSGTITGPSGADMTPATGTFTATLSIGCGTMPTGTATYSRIGNNVLLELPAVTCTSSTGGTTTQLSGIPASIRPATNQTVWARVRDNGTDQLGCITVLTTGTANVDLGADCNTIYTASGSRGWLVQTVSYLLN